MEDSEKELLLEVHASTVRTEESVRNLERRIHNLQRISEARTEVVDGRLDDLEDKVQTNKTIISGFVAALTAVSGAVVSWFLGLIPL
jgi:hypothetical protein